MLSVPSRPLPAGPTRPPRPPRAWRARSVAVTGLVVLTAAAGVMAQQADPRAAERATRRLQLQVDQLQTQLRQAQTARSEAEAARADLARQLEATSGASQRAVAAQRSLSGKASELQSERDALAEQLRAAQATAETDRAAHARALAERDAELAQARQRLAAQDGAAQELQGRFAAQVRLVTECTGRNEKLLELNARLIEQVRGSAPGANAPLSVFGFSRIQLFNQLQEQRDLAEAQRFVPIVEGR